MTSNSPSAGVALAFMRRPAPPPFRIVAEEQSIPVLDGFAEGSVETFVLEGIERWERPVALDVLQRIRGLLRPGGIARVVTPDLDAVALVAEAWTL